MRTILALIAGVAFLGAGCTPALSPEEAAAKRQSAAEKCGCKAVCATCACAHCGSKSETCSCGSHVKDGCACACKGGGSTSCICASCCTGNGGCACRK